jgi:aldehyde:ferredoxin oxidoreductase
MAKGYCGKIVHVNLDEKKIWIEEPDETFYRSHLGGSSLNLSYLLEKMAPGN